jgi:hypothetical protein
VIGCRRAGLSWREQAGPALLRAFSADIELVISSAGQETPPFLRIKDQIWTRVIGISKIRFIVRYRYLYAGIAITFSAPAPMKF